MPPCAPPRLRESLPFFSRRRALRRVAYAVALGAVLILPSALHPNARPVVAAVEPPAQWPVTYLGPDDEALSASRLPESIPDDWRKPPCPKAKSITMVRGACFLILKGGPPCDVGYEHEGQCLMPIAKMQRTPQSIGR